MPRNVVVVLLDSLNRHMLGSYGGTEFETPNLDRFARERAVRFTNHVTGSLPCASGGRLNVQKSRRGKSAAAGATTARERTNGRHIPWLSNRALRGCESRSTR